MLQTVLKRGKGDEINEWGSKESTLKGTKALLIFS